MKPKNYFMSFSKIGFGNQRLVKIPILLPTRLVTLGYCPCIVVSMPSVKSKIKLNGIH